MRLLQEYWSNSRRLDFPKNSVVFKFFKALGRSEHVWSSLLLDSQQNGFALPARAQPASDSSHTTELVLACRGLFQGFWQVITSTIHPSYEFVLPKSRKV